MHEVVVFLLIGYIIAFHLKLIAWKVLNDINPIKVFGKLKVDSASLGFIYGKDIFKTIKESGINLSDTLLKTLDDIVP